MTACWSSIAADEVSGKITGYGIVRVPADYKTVDAPDTAARAAREFLKETFAQKKLYLLTSYP